jgi:hypothetical protein
VNVEATGFLWIKLVFLAKISGFLFTRGDRSGAIPNERPMAK